VVNWAVFLDRDGVINEEVEYLSRPEQLRLIPGAAEAIGALNRREIPVIVVTNQAGLARAFFPEAQVMAVHRALAAVLQQAGARVDRFYYCPHHPTAGLPPYRVDCDCRKPKPGMVLQAADDFGLDLSRCILVGDKVSDLEAGRRAGCRTILVKTGYGVQVWADWAEEFQAHYVAQDLFDAVGWILG